MDFGQLQGSMINFTQVAQISFKKKMTKEKYIKEFGYEILDSDEVSLRLNMYFLYFAEVYLSQSELPGYVWN